MENSFPQSDTNPTIVNPSRGPKPPSEVIKGLMVPIIIMFLFTAVGFGMGGYYLGIQKGKLAGSEPAATDAPHESTMDSWVAYTNEKFGFTLKVPEGMSTEPSDKENLLIFKDDQGVEVLHVEAFEGVEATQNYRLNCSHEDTVPGEDRGDIAEISEPPFNTDKIVEYRQYPLNACFMIENKYINASLRTDQRGKPFIDNDTFTGILSSFNFN